ncbi:MAG: hypothetical protein MJ246_04505 [Clostridia bacterium]|nr:hypothetical protein [Clostridia bacterium]
MEISKLIELLTDGEMDEIENTFDKLVVGGKSDVITKLFAKYEKELAKLQEDEEFEDEANTESLNYYLSLFKGISKLILVLGKVLRVDNFEAIEDAYEIDEFAQGYVEDYKMYVEDFFDGDEKETEEMEALYEDIKNVFTDADYED